MTMLDYDLLPPPPVVRERLARTYREARLLRSLLRLSCKAVDDRVDHRDIFGVDPSPEGLPIPPAPQKAADTPRRVEGGGHE